MALTFFYSYWQIIQQITAAAVISSFMMKLSMCSLEFRLWLWCFMHFPQAWFDNEFILYFVVWLGNQVIIYFIYLFEILMRVRVISV